MTLPKLTDVGEMEILTTWPWTPVPAIAAMTGLPRFVALCAMERFAEAAPAVVGENCMVTVTDCPGDKLNAPPPLTTKNGGERVPTLPVNAAVELD